MFLALLFVTAIVALAVSALTAWLFSKPLDSVLKRIIADEISVAWLRFLKFAILVVGVSFGVPVHDLERYLGPAGAAGFTFDHWVLEIYRTAIEALQGIAWILLVFFVFALIAYVIVRLGEMRGEPTSVSESTSPKE
jgi:hypothetical protein